MTSEQRVRQSLERIAAFDAAGPRCNAMITIVDDVVDIARALDAKRREQGPRGPLLGIPVILTDDPRPRRGVIRGRAVPRSRARPAVRPLHRHQLVGALELMCEMHGADEAGSVVTLICDGGGRSLDTCIDERWFGEYGCDVEPYLATLGEAFEGGRWSAPAG